MDNGFDDLLAPSRDMVNNPFQDPFFSQAKSSSPHHWASYRTTDPSFNEEALAFGSTTSPTLTHNVFVDVGRFQDHENEDYAQEEYEPQEEETPVSASPADSLDTAAFKAAELAAPAGEAVAAATSLGLPTALVTSPFQSRGFLRAHPCLPSWPSRPPSSPYLLWPSCQVTRSATSRVGSPHLSCPLRLCTRPSLRQSTLLTSIPRSTGPLLGSR